jgi:hypothetical protein
MLSRSSLLPLAACALLLATSCNEGGKNNSGGPIVLGDPATIVTETDSAYLQDMVVDYQPLAAVTPAADTAQPAPAVDTPKVAAQEPAAEPEEQPAKQEPVAEKGTNIQLGGASILIPDITLKGRGTSYQLKQGSLNGKQIKVTEGTVQKISQRYQTVVVVKNNLGTLVLDNLSTTTGWKELKGGGKAYTIAGLEDRNLAAPKATPASIKSAVSRAARKSRANRRNEQKWLASVKKARSTNQKPLDVKLRSVMWKIDGKDAKGKAFSKQVRVDLPL